MSEPPGADLLIAHDSVDLESIQELAAALDRAQIRPQLLSERDFEGASGDPQAAIGRARALLFAVASPSVPDFMFKLARAARATPDGVPRPLFVALLREANERVAEGLDAEPGDVLDVRSGIFETTMVLFAGKVRARLDGPPPNVPDIEQISKRAPLPNEPAAPPPSPSSSPPTISEIWGALDDNARAVFAQAAAVARSRGSSQLHSEDLLIGLYREADGPTIHILQSARVSEQAVASMVAEQIPTISPAARLADAPDSASSPPLSRHSTAALAWAFDTARATDPTADITSQHLLAGLVSLTDCSVAEQLRDAGISVESVLAWRRHEPEPGPLAVAEALAGFRSDTTGGPDLLDIGPEVDAIATVLAARTVDPPLALGLFGDWGTGKTFFMDELETRIGLLAEREAAADRHGDDRVYCRNIVQLRFNAWHYIDENLWASLGNAIFEGLDDALARQDLDKITVVRRGKERANLILQRAQVQERLERRRQCQAEADRRAAAAQALLDQVDGMYDELVASIQPGAILAEGGSAALAQPAVADAIREQQVKVEEGVNKVATKAGIEPEKYRTRLAALPDGGFIAAWRALFDLKGWRVWLPIAGVALAAIGLTALLTAIGFDAAALVGVAIPVLVGVFGPLRPLIDAAATLYRVFADARKRGAKLVEDRREEVRQTAARRKQRRDKVADKFAADVQRDQEELGQVDKRLTELRPGREMADFVRIRQASNEYRSRLGIVARARDDFEELSRLLAQDRTDDDVPSAAKGTGNGATRTADPKRIERIILYIDDLDRCKEKEVVAVLQAVHLLLAFPLFVVVVAVDPRWLLHSLRKESGVFAAKQAGLTADDEDGLGWEATPLNYLEKIFQIPFALRPMGQTGFGAIVNHLVGYDERSADHGDGHGEADASRLAGTPPVADSGNGSGPSPGRTPLAEPAGNVGQSGEEGPQPLEAAAAAREEAPSHGPDEVSVETRPVEMNPRSLDISDDERRYMAQMYPLIGTPRGAKRFVNVYRLLKASHPVAEQGQFADPHVHRPVLLLLASLTGFPRETAEILRELVENAPDGRWWDFVLPFAEKAVEDTRGNEPLRAASWEQLIAKLRQVQAAGSPDLECADMRLRARRVARYSFESSRILFLEPEEAGSAKGSAKRRTRASRARAPKTAVTAKA